MSLFAQLIYICVDSTARDNKGERKGNKKVFACVFFGEIKHSPSLCPTSEPTLLSSATKNTQTHREKKQTKSHSK